MYLARFGLSLPPFFTPMVALHGQGSAAVSATVHKIYDNVLMNDVLRAAHLSFYGVRGPK
jgi:hypothetical protein